MLRDSLIVGKCYDITFSRPKVTQRIYIIDCKKYKNSDTYTFAVYKDNKFFISFCFYNTTKISGLDDWYALSDAIVLPLNKKVSREIIKKYNG